MRRLIRCACCACWPGAPGGLPRPSPALTPGRGGAQRSRLVQNLRRFCGYDLQYFAAIEPQKRLAPHVHIAIRGTISRAELREVVAATYHQVWWPSTAAVKDDGGHLPVWDEHTGTYLDPDTGEILVTWDQALDTIGDGDEPLHVARFGTRFDAQGVLAGSKDASRCIGYLTKYLTKHVGDCHQVTTDAQAAHAARLADALRYEPCSPTCANWLRYGIQPKNARPGLRPGCCKGKAHRREYLGLPDSMITATSSGRSWLEFCLSYVDMKWPGAAPKTRDALIDALATIIPVVVGEEALDGMDRGTLRGALRHFALAPASRELDRPPAAAAALRWLGKASLPVSEVGKPQHARAVLDAISVTQDGRAASATTIARKRSVFANVIRYAVELEELPSNPLDRLSWKPPKVSEVVDRRVVVNPRQARELLTAVTYVGQQRRGPHARGQRLMALYACMYFAAL